MLTPLFNVFVPMPTCDDRRCLTPHLVLVYVLAIVQLPFHQNPGAEGKKLN